MQVDLTGKTILVTGASRGIGRAIAEQLGHSGARVGIHCHQHIEEAEALARELGVGSKAYQADLSNPDEVHRLFGEVISDWKKLDVLVNNAGIAISTPLTDTDEDWTAAWMQTMAVNLTSAALLSRKSILHFLEGKHGGRIINISSRAAFRGDTPEYMAYAASKSGLLSLTKTIARAHGKQGIRAFVVAPGFVHTDMANDFIEQYGEDHARGDISLERLTEPKDLAPLIVFLASGLADHATGTNIDVNAGSYMH